MSIRPLPNDPSLEHLRKEAKRLRKALRSGDAGASAQVKEFHPRANEVITLFSLSDAQLVTARTYGFASWTKLKQYLTAIEPYVWNPPQPADDPGPLVDVFIKLACLNYGAWHRSNPEKARRLLAEHPELARASIYSAAASGDVSAAGAMIERDPECVKANGGPLRWHPLLYACYSRMDGTVPNHSTLEVARLLLSHGADPNAGFLWGGTYVFTALTGAFGEGEDGINQPPHPHRDALAGLLLDAGADPNDGQTLYNRHFRADDDHLKLLFAYGLGQDKRGPWFKRLGDQAQSPARLLVEELWSAAKNNFFQRVKLLIDHGVDVNTPGLRNGRTPYEEALRAGNSAIAQYLLEHGAKKVELDRNERFALACIAGRRAEALALLADDPSMLEKLGHRSRVDLVHRAVEGGRIEGVRLIVELGVDVNGMVPNSGLDRSPLHSATIGGNLEMVKLLLELGADPSLCDPTYHSTPIGWAYHGRQQHVVDYLFKFATIFDALRCDGVERVAELLEQDPCLANAADEGGNPLVFYLHPEMTRLEPMVQLLIAYGADLNAKNRKGKTLLDRALAGGWTDFADMLRAHGARPAADLNSAS
jgi:ankyrin repeat protein